MQNPILAILSLASWGALGAFVPFAVSQEPAAPVPAAEAAEAPGARALGARALGSADLRVPIHATTDAAAEAAEVAAGVPEIWAAGAGYKVSFHDGFAFYPCLGTSYPENLPLAWRTRSVTVGGRDLLVDGSRPATRFGDWRFEYHHGAVVEAYDVLARGVEQSFVLANDSGLRGDLVIEGDIETRLSAASSAERHGEVVFRGPRGEPLVSYGAAVAFDAAGRRTEVRTGYDGRTIRLTVPGPWLEGAAFPVTVDPLTSSVGLTAGQGIAAPSRAAVISVGHVAQHNTLVVHNRAMSATDWDCWAMVYDSGFGNERTIYTELSATFSSLDCAASFVGATNRWVIVHDRQAVGTQYLPSRITVYLHDLGNQTLNSGKVVEFGTLVGELRRPDVGGTLDTAPSGDNALVVFESHPTTGTAVDIIGTLIDTRTPRRLFDFLPAIGGALPNEEHGHPAITQLSTGQGGAWVVAWQERTVPGGLWHLRASLCDHAGTRVADVGLGPIIIGKHVIRPRVAGLDGRYLLTCTTGTDPAGDYGESIYAERFDWPVGSVAPNRRPMRLIAKTPGTNGYKNSDLAYDYRQKSHWALAWQRGSGSQARAELARVGHTGGTVEWQYTATMKHDPVVAFDHRSQSFPVVYSTSFQLSLFILLGMQLTYDPAAGSQRYGVRAAGTILAPTTPYAGHEFFSVDLEQGEPGKIAWLLASLAPASVPLDPIGMQGFYQNVALDHRALFVLPAVIDSRGRASIRLPLPDSPPFLGDLYFQWVFEKSRSTALGLVTTQGLRVMVR